MLHHKEFCKDVKTAIENQGDKLVITITGTPDKLKVIENKINALHQLFCDEGCTCC